MSLTKKLLLGAGAIVLAGLTIVSAMAAGAGKGCHGVCPKGGPCSDCPECPHGCPGC